MINKLSPNFYFLEIGTYGVHQIHFKLAFGDAEWTHTVV